MDDLENKSILFYSTHPNDQISRQFMEELKQNELLDRQFIKICVTDNNIKIPKKVLEANAIPVVATPGFSDLIKGEHALSWLRNNSFQGTGNGFSYGDIGKNERDSSNNYSALNTEFQKSDYNQHYNDEYNLGFKIEDPSVAAGFSKLKDDTHIVTYRDQAMPEEQTSKVSAEMQNIINRRNMEVPVPTKRIGGLDQMMPQQRPPRSQRSENGTGRMNQSNLPIVPGRATMQPRPGSSVF